MAAVSAPNIGGVIVPIVTPFTPAEEVDTASLRRVVDHIIDGGVHGIWVTGTTGEFTALSDEQRLLATETVVDQAAKRVPIIGNASLPGTRRASQLGRQLVALGCAGVAATPPYYYGHSQDELLAHYRAIAAALGQPVWVYNIPSTVHVTVAAATVAELAKEGAVVGIKDSSGAGEALAELVYRCGESGAELTRLLGSVHRLPLVRALGCHGVVPGIANFVPAAVVAAWDAGERGDAAGAAAALGKVLAAARVMEQARDGGPTSGRFAGLKVALETIGVIEHDIVSAPLRPLNPAERATVVGIARSLSLS